MRILFFLKVPPPFTGATYINKLISESHLLNKAFIIKKILISYKKTINSYQELKILKVFKVFRYIFLLLRNLVIFRPQIVYFQITPTGAGFIRDLVYVLIIKIFNIHIVYHLHGKGIQDISHKSHFYKKLYEYVFSKSSVICVSRGMAKDIENVYFGNPFIIPNAVPVINIPKRERIIDKKFRILFLSNILISKGFIDFLDSISILKDYTFIKFEACIAGYAGDFTHETILQEISKRSLDNVVEYLGPKYDNDKFLLLQSSDVLVFPTLNDLWGLVILEAMQAGTAVIATKEGAIPEIIEDGKSGFLVEKSNPKQIVEKILMLINNEPLRESLAQEGQRRFYEKYTFNILESNLKNTFSEILTKL